MHRMSLAQPLLEADNLKLSRWNYQLTFNQRTHLPPHTGSMLRGALGHALKLLLCQCVDPANNQPTHTAQCLYQAIFEQQAKGGCSSLAVQGVQHAPPAFVFSPLIPVNNSTTSAVIYQGQVTLLAAAHDHATDFFQALRLAAYRGFGPQQHSAALSCVEQLTINPFELDSALAHARALEIRLTSPLFIKRRLPGSTVSKAVQAHQFDFQAWLIALHRRLSILHDMYQLPLTTPLELSEWLQHSDSHLVTQTLHDQRFARHSNRQQQTMPLSGVLGTIHIHQPLPKELLTAMQLGQWLHIGGKTAFGLGAYQLQPIH